MSAERPGRRGLAGLLQIAALLALAALTSRAAAAQEMCAIPAVDSHEAAIRAFDRLRLAHCLGGTACPTSDCALVSKLEKTTGTDNRAAADRLLVVLAKLKDSAQALDAKQLAVAQLQQMIQRWSLPSLSASPQTLPTVILKSRTQQWHGQNLILFPGTSQELNLEAALCVPQTAAARVSAESCQADFQSVVAVYTLSDLIYRTLATATQDRIADVGVMLKTYDERWTAFHTSSLAVLPWELALNNLSYKSAAAGFSGPPDYQWLLLHPSAAVVYDTRQNDKLQPAILLDVIGRYQWQWGGQDNAQITRQFGYSLAMSWHGRSPGYGLAIHLPRNWSLALTRSHGNQWQFITSVEFAQYLTDKRKNVDTIRQQLDSARLP